MIHHPQTQFANALEQMVRAFVLTGYNRARRVLADTGIAQLNSGGPPSRLATAAPNSSAGYSGPVGGDPLQISDLLISDSVAQRN